MTTPTLTPEQVREWFRLNGINVSEWAREHGFNRHTVVDLLLGRKRGAWGESHRAAVALGLKRSPHSDTTRRSPMTPPAAMEKHP